MFRSYESLATIENGHFWFKQKNQFSLSWLFWGQKCSLAFDRKQTNKRKSLLTFRIPASSSLTEPLAALKGIFDQWWQNKVKMAIRRRSWQWWCLCLVCSKAQVLSTELASMIRDINVAGLNLALREVNYLVRESSFVLIQMVSFLARVVLTLFWNAQ